MQILVGVMTSPVFRRVNSAMAQLSGVRFTHFRTYKMWLLSNSVLLEWCCSGPTPIAPSRLLSSGV
ncbi:hypothetical protein B0G76_3677 [Paraburkholderia sp. BL23I1N1]|nr:hypothetical protein B0G76_3677 [Paraburkholderia sp. BL23I1N1]